MAGSICDDPLVRKRSKIEYLGAEHHKETPFKVPAFFHHEVSKNTDGASSGCRTGAKR